MGAQGKPAVHASRAAACREVGPQTGSQGNPAMQARLLRARVAYLFSVPALGESTRPEVSGWIDMLWKRLAMYSLSKCSA